ncbi:MAG TPA: hypothetical protein V6C63_17750, partial [Allocoleopsis sp.]
IAVFLVAAVTLTVIAGHKARTTCDELVEAAIDPTIPESPEVSHWEALESLLYEDVTLPLIACYCNATAWYLWSLLA